MKTIKLLSLFLAVSITACTSSEYRTANPVNIYGSWQLTAKSQNGTNIPLYECETQNTIQFSTDGSYLRQKYSTGEQGCELQSMTDTDRVYIFDGTNLVMEYEDTGFGHVQDVGLVTNLTENSFDISVEFNDDDAGYLT